MSTLDAVPMKTRIEKGNVLQLRTVACGETPAAQPQAQWAGPDEIRILIVDAHELFVEGIRTIIQNEPGMTVVGHAADRVAALEAAAMRPHVILLELVLQDQSTLEFLPDLIRIAGAARVLVVTGEIDQELQVRAVRLGAMGVLLKTEPGRNLFKAIRKIHGGEVWLRRSLVTTVVSGFLRENREGAAKLKDPEALKIATLTRRELEVVALIAQGLRNKQIGERLFISEITVRHHLTSIFEKLGMVDRFELLIYAYQHSLARTPPAPQPPAAHEGRDRVNSIESPEALV